MLLLLTIIVIVACFAYFINFMKTINHIKNMQNIVKNAYLQLQIIDDLENLTGFVIDVFIYIRKKKKYKYANEVVFQTLNMFTRVGRGETLESDIDMITNFAKCYYSESTVQEIGDIIFNSVIGGMRHQGLIK